MVESKKNHIKQIQVNNPLYTANNQVALGQCSVVEFFVREKTWDITDLAETNSEFFPPKLVVGKGFGFLFGIPASYYFQRILLLVSGRVTLRN